MSSVIITRHISLGQYSKATIKIIMNLEQSNYKTIVNYKTSRTGNYDVKRPYESNVLTRLSWEIH